MVAPAERSAGSDCVQTSTLQIASHEATGIRVVTVRTRQNKHFTEALSESADTARIVRG